MQKISAISWSANSMRLAVSTADRLVHLYDENGEKKDKFPTKPAEKGQKSYVVRAMAFSPDSLKLAVAQSDNIVFIYKLGTNWGDKKSICNKFPQSSSVTCLTWPNERANDIVFGLAEGKVRVGQLKTNKSLSLYSTDSYVVSVASSLDGESIISGHLDGSIFRFHLENASQQKILTHSSVPYALDWGEHIGVAGNDGKVVFYDRDGNTIQRFDYSHDDKVKEFTVATFNPSGECVVFGNFNRFYIFNYNRARGTWEENGIKHIDNLYSVTALCWKNDGSRLVMGSLCGSVDIFEALVKRVKKGKFEFIYVSPSQIIVKRTGTDSSLALKSLHNLDISKPETYQGRFIVAHTSQTLLLGDMESTDLSEIPWMGSGNEKFDFSNPGVCMIFNAGELTLVEYGSHEIMGTCRTEYMNPNQISARLNYGKANARTGERSVTKTIAYLLDLQTICIQDLRTNTQIATINHDSKIDFLELNPNGNKLLFRDKRRQLQLYNCKEQTKHTLLNYCNYVQWVPNSDVVVAQNRNNLCVWYTIDDPDKVTIYSIKGDVEEIERTEGKTDVIVDDGMNTISYTLDEALINFGFALESGDLEKAMEILEPVELTPETEANWRSLAKLALEEQNLLVAERCFAALGDVSKSRYLAKINGLIRKYQEKTGNDGMEFYLVQAKLAMLEKQFHRAETILLDHNEVDEAMDMYYELQRWDEAIRIAEKTNSPDVHDLKEKYMNWCIQSGLEDKAAELKEREGNYMESINFYLKGGMPAKAAAVVVNNNFSSNDEVMEKIASALMNASMYEKAGDFFERMDDPERALRAYQKGHTYKRAIELAKRSFPGSVVQLYEEWGDWDVSQKRLDTAINHYQEAGIFQKAIEAAISSRQWNRAVQLVAGQPPEVARPYYKQIAKYYSDTRQHDLAEKYYLKAGCQGEVFDMYLRANKWDQAYQLASRNMSEQEVAALYIDYSKKFIEENKLKQAEKLYLTVNEPDLAINMYKKKKQYDHMIRLVMKYRRELLVDTHLHLAKQLEAEGNFKVAEHHFVEGGNWQGAADMYRKRDLWDDALRVCKSHGTNQDITEYAKEWALKLGGDKGIETLRKNGMTDAAIDVECGRSNFEKAFELAYTSSKHRLPDVHLKYALYLEDEKRYKEAEEEFIKAGKPGEAINMWEHQQDWQSALAVAQQYEPQNTPQVHINQGRALVSKRDYQRAEQCFIKGSKPEMAIAAYKEAGMMQDAQRIAQKYRPDMLAGLVGGASSYGNQGQSGDEIVQQAKYAEISGNYVNAIELYLSVTVDHFSDPQQLEDIWEKAVDLAMKYQKDRFEEVVRIVAERLKDIGSGNVAASNYMGIGMYEEATDCYIELHDWAQAEDVIRQVERTPDLHSRLRRKVDQAKKTGAGATDLDPIDACERYFKDGEHERMFDVASKHSAELLNKYLLKYSKLLLKNGQFATAVTAFVQRGTPIIPNFYPIYNHLALEILAGPTEQELADLRKMLYTLVNDIQNSPDANTNEAQDFQRYLNIAHLANLKFAVQKAGLSEVYTFICISLVRYTAEIPIDRAYFEAGEACRDAKMINNAFVFLNQYIDLSDAIEDIDGAGLADNTDFVDTDIPSPFEIALPEKNFLEHAKREEIRDWVLETSISGKVEQKLNQRYCDHCNNKIYEGTLACPKCGTASEPCIVTGYPVSRAQAVSCTNCHKPALRKYWNLYIGRFSACPWCGSGQSMAY
eukprot:CAMPEP_0115035232 /NCGR_PEP_ID=MMETSP0216-20121206/41287_1 /TAXON_ID=223996 /ORGANISM="Protocruzia adherens, Strain Boccale" /LENGTH=1713 /DNA_ID=CAMNT_0002414595 /DNA_START=1 /DNA_END=5142 /DNA_ORIENTATION=+